MLHNTSPVPPCSIAIPIYRPTFSSAKQDKEIEFYANRCIVTGLSKNVKIDEVNEVFSQYGEIVESKIITDYHTGLSKGFGFVSFKYEQWMLDACHGLNGKKLGDNNITVYKARLSRCPGTKDIVDDQGRPARPPETKQDKTIARPSETKQDKKVACSKKSKKIARPSETKLVARAKLNKGDAAVSVSSVHMTDKSCITCHVGLLLSGISVQPPAWYILFLFFMPRVAAAAIVCCRRANYNLAYLSVQRSRTFFPKSWLRRFLSQKTGKAQTFIAGTQSISNMLSLIAMSPLTMLHLNAKVSALYVHPYAWQPILSNIHGSQLEMLGKVKEQLRNMLKMKIGRSMQKIRSGASVPARVSPIVEKEIAFHFRGCGNVRSFCHITPGCWINLKLVREVFRQEAAMQTWRRPFSSDSGDSVNVVVPPLAESISDGTLAKFLKKPGDGVNIDEPIAQIETDKVTIDVSSPESGVILKLLANEGDTIEPGNKIAIISRSADATTHVAPSETTPQKAAPQPTQKIIATRLKDSQNTFALLTTFNEVDMTNLMKLRTDYKDAFVEKHGVKLGLMSGFIKAAVNALQHQPIVNAVIDGDDIIYRDYIDISMAVGTPKGLVVPVIRNADTMNFADIEKQINTFAKKANNESLSIDEMA
ncbi:hypothetical protein RIF29_00025 [Crotalaria pallida]|uniref:Dihydrolipoamide acetyltransferase component of pyruvate dehydrogenase complex n=1 Tax=Crotalaria pallida TaxID=3830 RepID=A0AAN9P6C0_CROPI